MPFVSEQRREAMSLGGSPETVGDLCYLSYVRMMAEWRENRRWTTAHKIKCRVDRGLFGKDLWFIRQSNLTVEDCQVAAQLAWEVFFSREVMKYEEEKALENGEI